MTYAIKGKPNLPSISQAPLKWGNGPVQHNPQVYLVFLGPDWQSSGSALVQHMETLFASLAGGDYNNILSQYNDDPQGPNSYIHNTVQLAGLWIDTSIPPSNMSMADIANEAATAQVANNWPASIDATILVFPQQGTTYDSDFAKICGYHSEGLYSSTLGSIAIAFGMAMYPHSGCEPAGNNADNLAYIATHEYAEAATDPYADGSGWSTDGTSNNEIGDLCNQIISIYYDALSGQDLVVQELFDNSTDSCAANLGQDYYSSSAGKHTVYGPLYNAYYNLGQTNSVLGYPTDEAYPQAGGKAQEFQLTSCGNFQGSRLYWSPNVAGDAYEVQGCIAQEYLTNLQGPSGILGFPTSNEGPVFASGSSTNQIGRVSTFQNGNIYYNGSAWEVHGPILTKYLQLDGPAGSASFPTSDVQTVAGGYVSTFQGAPGVGQVNVYSSSAGAYDVQGSILQKYLSIGGSGSALGFPTSDEHAAANGVDRESDFQHGYIIYTVSNGQVTVYYT
ncbi:MAG TPA: hypothetical protein VKQ30_12300 [Ktedonobacterales bacterium]|nr:hypothetical protein [Ktedonobacterales bacterium]